MHMIHKFSRECRRGLISATTKMGKSVKEFLKIQLVQFGHFIYNPKTKEAFGRTGTSWIQILAYLTVLYAFLAALLAAHIYLFVAVTPAPAPNVRPWNFGRYAYPNYPNAKIALIANPPSITYNTTLDTAILDQMKSLTKTNNLTCGPDNKNCVFIYVARTFDWKPELIDSSIGDYLFINCSADKNVNYTVEYYPSAQSNIGQLGGIPLNLPNNVDSNGANHSFPYWRQDNFTLPVMAVWINMSSPQSLTVTCSIPYASLETPVFSNHSSLDRIYEYPANVQFSVG